MGKIKNHKELTVWRDAMDAALDIFRLTKTFPAEERYSLTDQIRRSSRSVAANIAEARRKRRYEGAFKSKLNDAEAEACETQTWLEMAMRCGYVERSAAAQREERYEKLMAQLVSMIRSSRMWTIGPVS